MQQFHINTVTQFHEKKIPQVEVVKLSLQHNPEAEKDVRGAVDWLVTLQTYEGNFPCAMGDLKEPRHYSEELVHWCHGAPGTVYLLARWWIFSQSKLAPTCTCCQSAPDLGRQRDRVHASSRQGGQPHVEEVGQSANCPVSLLTSQRFAEEGPRPLSRRCRLWLRLLAHVQADKVTN